MTQAHLPDDIGYWPKQIIQEVAFMSSPTEESDEMDAFEICAVVRCRLPEYRYINPSDISTIAEWLLDPAPAYGGLKDEIKTMIATLGESQSITWREKTQAALRLARRKGWDSFDVFEAEDPRRSRGIGASAERLEIPVDLIDPLTTEEEQPLLISHSERHSIILSGDEKVLQSGPSEAKPGKDIGQSGFTDQAKWMQMKDTIERDGINAIKDHVTDSGNLIVSAEPKRVRKVLKKSDWHALEANKILSEAATRGVRGEIIREDKNEDANFREQYRAIELRKKDFAK